MMKLRPQHVQNTIDELRTSRQDYQQSVSALSKSKSQASLRMVKMDAQRMVSFNQDLALKLSYAWKNVYRGLKQ